MIVQSPQRRIILRQFICNALYPIESDVQTGLRKQNHEKVCFLILFTLCFQENMKF